MPPDAFSPDLPLSDTVYGTLINATCDRVKALKLANIKRENIVIREFPWDKELPKPCIVVSPSIETVNWRDGTNERDDVVYVVTIAVMKAGSGIEDTGLGYQLEWREKIRRACHNQSPSSWGDLELTGGLVNHTVKQSYVTSAGPTFFAEAKDKGFDAHAWLVAFVVKEKRITDADLGT
jgi:hypothetical protein